MSDKGARDWWAERAKLPKIVSEWTPMGYITDLDSDGDQFLPGTREEWAREAEWGKVPQGEETQPAPPAKD